MDQGRFRAMEYKISGDNTLLDEVNNITPEIRRILDEIRPDLQKGRKYLLKKLNRLCTKYPRVPVFKNMLSTLYQQRGNTAQAFAVNHWLVKEHPDYLFGKLNLAAELLLKNEPKKIPEILGEYMEIGQLYPKRREFHSEEVIGFNAIAVEYFLALDKIEDAELRAEVLEELDEDHHKTLYVQQLLREWYYSKAAARLEQQQQERKAVPVKDERSHLQTLEPPKFHFPEQIAWLYTNDLNINPEKIEQLLQLDREKFSEDLEKMLQDSVSRFNYFVEKTNEEGYDNSQLDFPMHALLLLAELENPRSLDEILALLKQDQDFNDFWFGDFINQVMESALYHCGKNSTFKLFEFLKLPNVYNMNKGIVGEALVKINHDSEERREDLLTAYREILQLYIDNADDENFADTEAVGFLVSDLIDLNYHELLPEIKELFDLELVETFISGTYADVEKDIIRPVLGKNLDFIMADIFQKYEALKSNEHDMTTAAPEEDDLADLYNREMLKQVLLDDLDKPFTGQKKVGRNDPCPCGSGKKYKKCCMN